MSTLAERLAALRNKQTAQTVPSIQTNLVESHAQHADSVSDDAFVNPETQLISPPRPITDVETLVETQLLQEVDEYVRMFGPYDGKLDTHKLFHLS